MKCPYCASAETKVIDKRDNEDVSRRRRECLECEKRFTTYERVEDVPLFVVKKDGRRETFDRNKLRNGFLKACEKRPVSIEQIEAVLNEIENKLRNEDTTEMSSDKIGGLVIKKLKALDKVAYIRFASVYQNFTDVEHFKQEIEKLLKK